jgi:hypothetical protein
MGDLRDYGDYMNRDSRVERMYRDSRDERMYRDAV